MRTIAETAVVAAVGGSLFACTPLPLPWMLGAISALLVWNTATRRTVRWPVGFCYAGLLLVGYSIGRTFPLATLQKVAEEFAPMLLATLAVSLISLALGWFTHRHTGITLASALLGTLPGGLSQTTVLCREVKDADLTVVLFMQTFRLLTVIFVVPMIAMHGIGASGATMAPSVTLSSCNAAQLTMLAIAVSGGGFCARFLRLPTPFLLGPILVAAGLALSGILTPPAPREWLSAAQLSIGAYTGARVRLTELKNWRKLLPHTIFNIAALLIVCLSFGWLLERWEGLGVATAFLSMAPGGVAEMSLTAMAVGADLSAVVAFQLFRLLFLLLVITPPLKWWLLRRSKKCRNML